MDPPRKFNFNLDIDRFWWKLKITSLVFCFNAIIALSLMATAYYALDGKTLFRVVSNYAAKHNIIFAEPSWANFLLFLYFYCISSPILEEFTQRYPVILLLNKNFKIKLPGYDLTRVAILLIVLLLNSLWSYSHIWALTPSLQKNYYHLLPPFLVGFPLYWLVIKTRTLWPAILCHGALNLSLYFLVQLMIYLEFNPVFITAQLLKIQQSLQSVPR